MDHNPIRWFEMYVQDMNRAKRFYESVFELKLERLTNPGNAEMEMWSFPMLKDRVGTGGALVKMNGVGSGGNSTVVYFASDDCAIEAARVSKCGGKIHKGKFSIGEYGFIALAYDTEGNMFGIHSL